MVRLATKLRTIERLCQVVELRTTLDADTPSAVQQCSREDGSVAAAQRTMPARTPRPRSTRECDHVAAAQSFAKIQWRNPPATVPTPWPPSARPETGGWRLSRGATGAAQETQPVQYVSKIQWRHTESLTRRKALTIGCELDDERLLVIPNPPDSQVKSASANAVVLAVDASRTDDVLASGQAAGGPRSPPAEETEFQETITTIRDETPTAPVWEPADVRKKDKSKAAAHTRATRSFATGL